MKCLANKGKVTLVFLVPYNPVRLPLMISDKLDGGGGEKLVCKL